MSTEVHCPNFVQHFRLSLLRIKAFHSSRDKIYPYETFLQA